MKKLLSTLFISTALLFVGCEGDEGPQGPAGPAGADGNANVKSETFTVAPEDWKIDPEFNDVYVYKHGSNILNSEIREEGMIEVYYESNSYSDTSYISLPVTIGGQINVSGRVFESNPDTLTLITNIIGGQMPDSYNFKIVAIEGNPARIKAEVDFGNYEMVQKYFGLED